MKKRLEQGNAVILFLMFLITFFQVVSRVVLSTSSVWSEELARLTYVVMVFLGAALLVRDDGLIRVTALTDRVGKRTGQIFRIVTDLFCVPFVAVMTWGAWTNTRANWTTYAPTIDWLSFVVDQPVQSAQGCVSLPVVTCRHVVRSVGPSCRRRS